MIINRVFLETLEDFANKSLVFNQQKGTNSIPNKDLGNRQSNQFIHLLRSLLIILGEGFVLEVLKDKKGLMWSFSFFKIEWYLILTLHYNYYDNSFIT